MTVLCNKQVLKTGILFFTITLFFSCKSKLEREIAQVQINSSLYRFDALLSQEKTITPTDVSAVKQARPQFYDVFTGQILHTDTTVANSTPVFKAFKNYFDSIGVTEQVTGRFPNFKKEKKQIDGAFRRVKHYFPNYSTPDVITLISGFNYKNFLIDSAVCIGLEMYLADELDYKTMGEKFTNYQIKTFYPEFIAKDVMESVVNDLYPESPANNTFLLKMLYNGKKLFFLEKMLPKTQKHILIDMTADEYEWCEKNERLIWQYFIKRNILYSHKAEDFRSYILPGPFSVGMPEGAPANTGSFVGWQIINAYTARQKKAVQEVMATPLSNDFLHDAQYQPRH